MCDVRCASANFSHSSPVSQTAGGPEDTETEEWPKAGGPVSADAAAAASPRPAGGEAGTPGQQLERRALSPPPVTPNVNQFEIIELVSGEEPGAARCACRVTHLLVAVGVPVLQAQAMVDAALPVPAAVALAVFEKRQELNRRLQVGLALPAMLWLPFCPLCFHFLRYSCSQSQSELDELQRMVTTLHPNPPPPLPHRQLQSAAAFSRPTRTLRFAACALRRNTSLRLRLLPPSLLLSRAQPLVRHNLFRR